MSEIVTVVDHANMSVTTQLANPEFTATCWFWTGTERSITWKDTALLHNSTCLPLLSIMSSDPAPTREWAWNDLRDKVFVAHRFMLQSWEDVEKQWIEKM